MNPKPLFDPSTHYYIEVRGRLDVEWLKGFDNCAEIRGEDSERRQANTVLEIRTDQAGMVGLIRRLHGLGVVLVSVRKVPGGCVIEY